MAVGPKHPYERRETDPKERRDAFDVLDVRDSFEQLTDMVCWAPTDHLRVVRLTKCMPSGVLTTYLSDMVSALKYDHDINDTQRACANARTACRSATQTLQGVHRSIEHTTYVVRNAFTHVETERGSCLGRLVTTPAWDMMSHIAGAYSCVHASCREVVPLGKPW